MLKVHLNCFGVSMLQDKPIMVQMHVHVIKVIKVWNPGQSLIWYANDISFISNINHIKFFDFIPPILCSTRFRWMHPLSSMHTTFCLTSFSSSSLSTSTNHRVRDPDTNGSTDWWAVSTTETDKQCPFKIFCDFKKRMKGGVLDIPYLRSLNVFYSVCHACQI